MENFIFCAVRHNAGFLMNAGWRINVVKLM